VQSSGLRRHFFSPLKSLALFSFLHWRVSPPREATGMQPFAILQTARLPNVHKSEKCFDLASGPLNGDERRSKAGWARAVLNRPTVNSLKEKRLSLLLNSLGIFPVPLSFLLKFEPEPTRLAAP
jgi:hypothetical protein